MGEREGLDSEKKGVLLFSEGERERIFLLVERESRFRLGKGGWGGR